MNKKLLSFLAFASLFSCALTACDPSTAKTENREYVVYADGSSEPSKTPTISASPDNGQVVEIAPVSYMNYACDLDDPRNADKYYTAGVEDTKPRAVTITWNAQENVNNYVLYLSDNSNMSNPQTFFTLSTSYDVKDLFAGKTYYYQVHAYFDDYTVISRKFNFKTYDFSRTLDIDGVQNARDFGNKITANGDKKIKQGLVYRSATLDSVTEKGKKQAELIYGIKTDLDLRAVGPTSSPLGSSVNYVNNGYGTYGSPYYVSNNPNSGSGIDTLAYQPSMKENLKVFANQNNYPVLFHCAVGRDRTGTLAIVLGLLLGADVAQLKQDYCCFVFTSICNDSSSTYMYNNMNSIFVYFSNYVGNDNISNGDIYDRAEEYCLDIGVTASEISSIRNILLEDVE